MGIYCRIPVQLASPDMVIAYGGYSIIRIECRRPSRYERHTARRQHGFVVRVLVENNPKALTKHLYCCLICRPSAARRVRGMDFGTEGRIEYVFRNSGPVRVCLVRTTAATVHLCRG